MGWIDELPKPECVHPGRPVLHFRDQGRRWECDKCRLIFRAEFVDYGHDVQGGEPSSEMVWRLTAVQRNG